MATNNIYQSFFDNSPVGFWRTSVADGKFILANLACAKILGYKSVAELLETNAANIYVGKNARSEYLQKLQKEGCIHDYEVEIIRPDGLTAWLSITARQESDFIEGFIEDITQEKESKERLCSLRQQEVEKLGEVQKNIKKRLKDMSIYADSKRNS